LALNRSPENDAVAADTFVEDVEISGHIIDSLILPKVLDCISTAGGTFRIKTISIGQARNDASYGLVEVRAESSEQLAKILGTIADHGAIPTVKQDCHLIAADMNAAFPEGFYSTTNQRTEIRMRGEWMDVAAQEMDCGVVVDESVPAAGCVPMSEIRAGQQVVVGHAGVRVFPHQRETRGDSFEFMSSGISTEKPKAPQIRQIAQEFVRARRESGKTLVVGGPAIVHTGSGDHFCELIRGGYVNYLFAGNALATHDIEQSIYGTSLGVYLDRGDIADSGHEHHLRAINRIRRAGGIQQAVDSGVLTSGIMYECVRHGTDYLLAGSIRDDGPLPEVITDVLEAQRLMREKTRDVTFCLMIATALHSIAVGNLLPAWVKVVCVDINPSTVIKLSDRGSFQTVGMITDVEPFLRALVDQVRQLESD
jgi:lysine-ketoglutarate reductase/saccharopine dehydrogenase-like protein (TIGR00300 family)